jgi:hypothetical protein
LRDEIWQRPSFAGAEPLITHGVLSKSLERILTYLGRSPADRDRWSAALGANCGRAETVASLLLQDALARRPDAVVLVSTTRPEHLHGLGSLVSSVDRGDSDALLAKFRRLVNAELAPR